MRIQKKIFSLIILITLVFTYTTICATEASGNFKIGKSYHGFKLTEEKQINELSSTVMIFEHLKTGAHVLYMKNDDDNKVFSINFPTLPRDDTGVYHILEHSILCGSEKYPVRSSIKSMSERSLKTFLNALTYADCTMYPIASRNYKDFQNLMGVYLDAVFYPNLIKNPKIFLQEAWRYELNSKDENLSYNGIVYNEMKGAYTSPETILHEVQMKALFPDSPYQYVSGGKPEAIPTLTVDKYLATYKNNYHPSNSYIYLYGNLDIMLTLKFINDEYLGNFNKKNFASSIAKQPPFNERVNVTSVYPVSSDTSVDNKSYLSLSYVFDTKIYDDNPLAVSALSTILTGLHASPLRSALLDANIGEEVLGYVTMDLQPTLNIIVRNCSDSKKDEFVKIVDDTLSRLVKAGIDKQLIEALLTTSEINLRTLNSSANRGIQYNKAIMSGWQYFNAPTKFIQFEKNITDLKKALNSDYFEKMIKKYLIDNNHSALVVLNPQPGLAEEKLQAETKELYNMKQNLSEAELQELIDQTRALKAWQTSPDSIETVESLPKLSLSDIDRKVTIVPTKENEVDGITVLNHPMFTNELVYVNMYFDASTVPNDKVPYLYLLSSILGKVSTEKYSSINLSNELMKNTGGFSANVSVLQDKKNNLSFYPKLIVSTYTTSDKVPKAFELVNEILIHSKFEDTKDFKILLNEIKSSLVSNIVNNNISFAIERNMSYYVPSVRYQNNATLQLYELLSDIDKNYESKKNLILKNLRETAELVFNKNKLVIGVTSDIEGYNCFTNSLLRLTSGLKDAELPRYNHQYASSFQNEAFVIPAEVHTVVKGANYLDLGYTYSGSMNVLNNLVNSYLFQAVRIQGGAYGGQFYTDMNGTAMFFSYSDPNIKETLAAYDNTEKYLQHLSSIQAITESTLCDLIINTIGQMDYPLSPQQKGTRADIYYLTNMSYDDLQRIRDEIINTKTEDLNKYIEMISSILKNGTYTVVGSQTKIEENKNLFSKIINPLNCPIPAYPFEDTHQNDDGITSNKEANS